jgi:hypothetical protein
LTNAATTYLPGCLIKRFCELIFLTELMNDVMIMGSRSLRETDVASPCTGLRPSAYTRIWIVRSSLGSVVY